MMDFGVLGPVTLTGAKGAIDIGGPRQRRLLAALLAHANQVVSTDRLIEIVFEGEPPAGATTTIRTYVARLRRSMAEAGSVEDGWDPGDFLVTEARGYKLVVDVDHLDAARFEASIDTGRQLLTDNDPVAAVSMLRAGLSLWRGDAYGEFAYEEWARAGARRLEELRAVAAEELNEALLACGLNQDVVFETQQLVEIHPLRDRLRAQLALALFRSGRQAESLRSLDDYRSTLAGVGLERSEKLKALERSIVLHDPALRLDSPAGRPLRGYRVGIELGEGRHGVVYRAVQPGVGREVAIKTIRARLADQPDFIRRFDAEAQLVAHLEHPHIVPIYDYWREPGGAYIVMRLLSGSIEDRLDGGPMDIPTVVAMAKQLGGALTAAHRAGVVHGDIKPSNVLIDHDDVYLADFGVATISGEPGVADDDYPSSGYESPELLTGQPQGKAADQFALAVLLTQMLTGTLPFGRRSIATEHDRAPSIHVQRPSVPAQVDKVIWTATAWCPEDRYEDVAAFVSAFTRALEGRGPVADESVSPVTNPYRGLQPFTEADGSVFYGRANVVDEMIDRLRRPGTSGRFLAVVGPSGGGKSSVVRAGLLPQLRAGSVDGSDGWFIATMVPGTAPFEELEAALRSISSGDSIQPDTGTDRNEDTRAEESDRFQSIIARTVGFERDVLIVIDQFEELFTRLDDEAVRDAFLAGLATAVQNPGSGFRCVITLRADFYDRPLRSNRFGPLMKMGTLPLVALSAAELEETVTQPAAHVGVDVEARLLTQLVSDVVNRPAALPLLQFTLSELFEQRSGPVLTLHDYERLGGVEAALARRAEDTFEALSTSARELARILFLRLVTIDDAGVISSNRTPLDGLRSLVDTPDDMDGVIEAFGAARLVVFDRDRETRAPTVEIAHEALIGHWPRFARWIADAGEGVRVQTQIAQAARLWDELGRQNSDLYRGLRLESALEWAAIDPASVRPIEREFLDAARRLREDEAERDRRVNRRLRLLLVGLGAAFAVAVIAGSVAILQAWRAERQAEEATTARGAALAAASINVLDEDRSLALLLAVESSKLDQSPLVHRALLGGLVGPGDRSSTAIPTGADDYTALAVTTDKTVAVARRSDGSLDVVDLVNRLVVHKQLPGPFRPFGGLSIDPTGTWVASGGIADDVAAVVYSLESGDEVARFAPGDGFVHWVGFSPDGETLLVADDRGSVVVYSVDGWEEQRRFETGFTAIIPELAMSNDGTRIYMVQQAPAEDQQGIVAAIDALTGEVVAGVPIDDDAVLAMEVAGDGTLYVAEERISRLDGRTLQQLDQVTTDAPLPYFDLAVLDDGRLLAGSPDELISVAFPSGEPPRIERIDEPTSGVEGLGGTGEFVTAGVTGSLLTWTEGPVDDLGSPLDPVGPGVVSLSPDGSILAVWGMRRGVQLFDRESLDHLGELAIGSDRSLLGVDFSSDGTQVAVLDCPVGEEPFCVATVSLWDVEAMELIVGPVEVGAVFFTVVDGVAFTADDRRLVTAGDDGIRLWDVADLGPVGPARRPSTVSAMASDTVMVVSTAGIDGRSLVAATSDRGHTVVWELHADDLIPIDIIEAVPAMFLDDGTLLAGIANGAFVARDPFMLQPTGPVYRAEAGPNLYRQIGPDLVASMAGPGGLELWDRATGEPMSGPLPFAFAAGSPDGRTLYLGATGAPGFGREVRALSLAVEDLTRDACLRAGRNLTGPEWRSLMGADEPYRVTCAQWPDARDLG